MLDTVNLYLASRGIRITTDTIVDATIIHAPSSIKNENKERDPKMNQAKKGNRRFFGMKAHIGVNSRERIVHSVCSTVASVADVQMLPELLHAGCALAEARAISQSPPRAQVAATRVLHPNSYAVAAAVFCFNHRSTEQAPAPRVFHFNYQGIQQALAPGLPSR